jgi:hypothetical protein
MRKILLAIVLGGAVLASASTGVIAQVTTKAYAPEDLSRLSEQDRVRVIEKEYADQSRGRSIPDDQLEFYLDQVQSSRWSFSQIKEDIAVSLGGGRNDGGWNPNPGPGPGGPGPGGLEVRCESRNDRYVECQTGFRGPAVVARNLSSTRCVDGVNFGSLAGAMWVNNGCRAVFVEGRFAPPPVGGGGGAQINCDSRDDRYRECRTNFRGRAELVRQTSDQRCVEGRTWGNKPGVVWVNRGCRGVFGEARGGGSYPGNDYSVTCNSDDGRRKSCAWNPREGTPRLIEQISQTPCIVGRTWGYDRRDGLWVERGCRARFGN